MRNDCGFIFAVFLVVVSSTVAMSQTKNRLQQMGSYGGYTNGQVDKGSITGNSSEPFQVTAGHSTGSKHQGFTSFINRYYWGQGRCLRAYNKTKFCVTTQ
jgi:hypothetical protein